MTDTPSGKTEKPAGPEKHEELSKKDPMVEMFGPGTSAKMAGDPDDQIPDEVRAVLDMHGLAKRGFTCMLKAVPDGAALTEGKSNSSNTEFIKGWTRTVPSLEYISRNHGPGTYLLCFAWKAKVKEGDDDEGTVKPMYEEVPIVISQKAADDYKDHRLQSVINRASRASTKLQEELVEKELEGRIIEKLSGQKKSTSESAKEYIKEIIETSKLLGIPVGLQQQPQVPAKQTEWDKILPSLIAGLTALLKYQQDSAMARQNQFNQLLMLLLTQNQGANNQLFEALKLQAGVGSGAMQFKEVKDMIFSAIDIKEALKGEPKETVADKIFKLIESLAPYVLSAATAARTGRPSPMVDVAKGYIATNPDFKVLQNSPDEMKSFITKMDNFYGWKQTDMILEVANWTRPDYCPRDPAKENPPQNGKSTSLPQDGTVPPTVRIHPEEGEPEMEGLSDS